MPIEKTTQRRRRRRQQSLPSARLWREHHHSSLLLLPNAPATEGVVVVVVASGRKERTPMLRVCPKLRQRQRRCTRRRERVASRVKLLLHWRRRRAFSFSWNGLSLFRVAPHRVPLYIFLLLGRSCLQCCCVVVRGAAPRGLWALPPPPPDVGAASPSPSRALSSRICLMR